MRKLGNPAAAAVVRHPRNFRGLVAVADRFAVITRGATRRLEVCSRGPIDHDPVGRKDDRAIHEGHVTIACRSDISFEARNLFLDRALALGSVAEPAETFFDLGCGCHPEPVSDL
jgi:hypothetical protein